MLKQVHKDCDSRCLGRCLRQARVRWACFVPGFGTFVFLFFLRASEMLAMSQDYDARGAGLRRGDVALFRESTQLTHDQRHVANRVEVRFRSSKGDQ